MVAPATYEDINESKADFDTIYNKPDPRAYFATLGSLDYRIPQEAKPIFHRVVGGVVDQRDLTVPTVVDVGCSYGINAALLKYDMEIRDLYAHYTDPEIRKLDADELAQADQRMFARQDVAIEAEVVGVDTADNAIAYAENIGLLDHGVAENFEEQAPSDAASQILAPADAVISTGCIGYVTEASFDHILEAVESASDPWVGSFVLRMFPFDQIRETLADRGMVTEKLPGRTFLQRRFADAEEKQQVLDRVQELGIDPTGKESEGYFHAEFFLTRTGADAARLPLERLLTGAARLAA